MDTKVRSCRPASIRRQSHVNSLAPSNLSLVEEGLVEEETLIQACRRGDRDSQRKLYERHCQQVYRLMVRMVGLPHADETLEHALVKLDPDLRVFFLLRELEQFSYYEIAMSLDIAEGTVASRLSRARRLLRELITEEPLSNE